MAAQSNGFLVTLVEQTINGFVEGMLAAAPRLLAGLVFVTLAYVAIRLVLSGVRSGLQRVYSADERAIADLTVTVAAVFLWFAAALALLKIVGMGDIAASLGTATGFIGLGIAYAMSDMIADTVAGVYLIRDPDFAPGDRVTTGSVTGTVRSVDLRKSRIELDDGDTAVLANRNVEEQWTKEISGNATAA